MTFDPSLIISTEDPDFDRKMDEAAAREREAHRGHECWLDTDEADDDDQGECTHGQ